jgi:hypothetical protein
MKERQAVTREYKPRCQKAAKKDKRILLDEFTRLTGYHRKSAARQPKPVMVYRKGAAVKIKPEKKRPANRTGKRIYTEEVVRRIHLGWVFFWYKCGRTFGSADPRPAGAPAYALHRLPAGLRHHPRNC